MIWPVWGAARGKRLMLATRATRLVIGLAVVAACAGPTPPTTTETPAPAATTRPPPPAASPSADATATPTSTAVHTPSAAAQHPVVDRFLSDFALAQPPFHVATLVTATISAGGDEQELEVTVEGDIAGEDFAGFVETPTAAGRRQIDVVIVGGTSYARVGDAEWQLVPDFRQTQPMNPFSRLSPADVAYVGRVSRDGAELHQLRTTTWIGGELEIPQLDDAELESSDFDIYVTEDGTPIEATLEFTVGGSTAQGPASFEYDVTYEFSRVGQPVSIEPPPLD